MPSLYLRQVVCQLFCPIGDGGMKGVFWNGGNGKSDDLLLVIMRIALTWVGNSGLNNVKVYYRNLKSLFKMLNKANKHYWQDVATRNINRCTVRCKRFASCSRGCH